MPEPQPKSPNVALIATVGVLALLAYQLFTGLVFQEVGIPGIFTAKFGPRASESGAPVAQSRAATATREFVVGRWQMLDTDLRFEFFEDGSMSVVRRTGSFADSGLWEFTRKDDYNFHLNINYKSHPLQGNVDFGIRDHDHISQKLNGVDTDVIWARLPN